MARSAKRPAPEEIAAFEERWPTDEEVYAIVGEFVAPKLLEWERYRDHQRRAGKERAREARPKLLEERERLRAEVDRYRLRHPRATRVQTARDLMRRWPNGAGNPPATLSAAVMRLKRAGR